MPEKPTRFSFSQTAAQQPARQRFSFSQAAPPKPKTLQQTLDESLPTLKKVRDVTAQMTPTPRRASFGEMAREIVIPGRGFSDQEIAQAKPTAREKITGGAKAVGEIGVGLTSLLAMGGNQLMRVLPGYDKEDAERTAEMRRKILEPIEPFITPKTAGEAQVMRFADIAGLAIGWTKTGRLDKLKKALVNVDNTEDARKLLRSGDLPDEVIDRLKLDAAAVNIRNANEASAFVRRVEDVMETASDAAKITAPVSARQATPTTVAPPRRTAPFAPARVADTPDVTTTAPTRFSFADAAAQTPAPAARTTPTPTSATPTTRTDITRSKIEADLDEARFIDSEVMPQQTLSPTTLSAAQQWVSGGNRRVMNDTVIKELDSVNIKPQEPVTLYRIGDISDTQFQSWSKRKPTQGEKFTERTFTPDEILVDTTDPRFVNQFTGQQREVIENFNKIENEVIVKPASKTPTAPTIKPSTSTQTANAERAEQVIKRQPKPEEIAKEAADSKQWDSNPVKAQAEATQEVAARYSNTVADQGFISEGAAKIDGVPPVKNVTAKARNFANDKEVPIDLPPETMAQYLITQVQDTAYRLGFVQKQLNKSGVNISDDANAYLQREAYIGRAASKIEKKRKELGMVAGNKNGLFMRMKRDNIDVESLDEYMKAKAATDRNNRVAGLKDGVPDGGSGITNAEAAATLAKYKGNTKIEAYAKEFRDSVITPRLQLLKEAGILTDEQIANITKYEPNYVPFKVAEFDRIQGGGKGFSVKGSGVKGLKGSARKDRTNSVMQSVADYEDAVQRAEKNKSLQAMGKLIEENPDKSLWEVKGVQYMPQYDEAGELQFLRQRPLNDKTSVEFFKDGKAYEIRIHDEALAKVFTQEGMYKPIAALRVINNYLRAVNTVINPEFMITNALRDLQTALVIAGGEKGAVTAAKMTKDYPSAMKGIWQAVRKESDTGWAKTYNEMVEAGGRTGWFDLQDVANQTKEVSKLVNRYNSNKTSDALMRAVDGTAKLISDTNEAAEMAIRVSAYKQLVDGGMSKVQSANYAKNMTVNFNKRGNIGMLANSLYLFANAGIQGSARLLMAMKNKKVRRITYGIVASSYAINELNNKVNPEGYARVQDFEKERNLIVMLPLDGNKYNLPGVSGDPSTGYYFKVPLPYGFNVFKVAGDAAYDVVNKKKTSGEVMKQMLMAINASFNPLSSGTPIQFVSPTVVDPFVASWENKNWFGAPIMPDQPAFAPAVRDSDRYFSGARDISVETAQFLNRITGGNEVTAGAVDISPETIDHVIDSIGGGLGNFLGQSVDGAINVVKGDIPTPEEMPFVRKFIDTPFEKGEQMQAFNLLEQSATRPLNQIQTDRFVDAVIEATVRGDMTIETGERMFTQFQQNVARNYAGEILSLFNENKMQEALELYQSTPTQVKKELDKLIEDDFEREIKRQQ